MDTGLIDNTVRESFEGALVVVFMMISWAN